MKNTKSLIAKQIQKNLKRLNEWYDEKAKEAPAPFYCSIDLRDSGYKIAPVDCNLYPAGFNNICPEDQRTAPGIVKARIESMAASFGAPIRKVLLLPEANTKNTFYLENLHYLRQILRDAGFETEAGWYGPLPEELPLPLVLRSETGKEIQMEPIWIDQGVMKAGEFVPDLVILNNDFSSGYPKELDDVKQPVVPSHRLGWHSRKKSEHFRHYNALAKEFASIIEIDPWLVQVETEEVEDVNFNEDQGTDRVAEAVGRVLESMRVGFSSHGVSRKPFVFVKNNAGTYGMGIMVAHSIEDLTKMNRRTKNKMSVGKNKSAIDSVVVQEGIPTTTVVDRVIAEPVIYLCGPELIGGFLRTNTERTDEDNLNSQGMVFKKLCMSDLREATSDASEDEGDASGTKSDLPILELVYGSIARISALAAGRELLEALKSSD